MKVDLKQAVEYYHISEDRGYYVATYHFGEMYERGIYFDRDISKALEKYWEAADRGYWPAKVRLRDIYSEGILVKRDMEVARRLSRELDQFPFRRRNDSDRDVPLTA